MKRVRQCILALATLAFMVFGAQTVMAAQTGTTEDGFEWMYEEGVMAITGYSGDATTVNIPAKINGHAVTRIHNGAFRRDDDIEKVIMPNSVTVIGEETFSYCVNLSSVILSNSLTEIGWWAFKNCESLTGIVLPNSLKTIGTDAFSRCESLTSITIPNSMTKVYDFNGCTGLTSVTIPDSVTSLGGFSGCTGLTSVTIPDSVASLGGFDKCTGLTSITIPDSVTSLRGFYGCTGIKNVTIPKTVKIINDKTLGYYTDALGTQRKISGFTINGYYGTAAEGYAKDNGFTFVGTQSNIADVAEVTGISEYGYDFTGDAIIPEYSVCYKYDKGYPLGPDNIELKEGADYTASITNNINAGTATITVTGINRFKGTMIKTFTINPAPVIFNIEMNPVEFEYTGAEIKPQVIVTVQRNTNDTVTLVEGTDYAVSYNNNIEVGTATVTVIGINNYSSVSDKSFRIIESSNPTPTPTPSPTPASAPAPAAVVQEPITVSATPVKVKAKAKKNKVTVSWKKIKKNKTGKALLKQISSIQVQYSTDPGFTQNVFTKNVAKKKFKVVLKLQKKTTYYIRMRYVGSGGYSNWSGVKRIKTK